MGQLNEMLEQIGLFSTRTGESSALYGSGYPISQWRSQAQSYRRATH